MSSAHLANTPQSHDEDIELAIHQSIQHLPISDVERDKLQIATLSAMALQMFTQLLKTDGLPTLTTFFRIHDYWNT